MYLKAFLIFKLLEITIPFNDPNIISKRAQGHLARGKLNFQNWIRGLKRIRDSDFKNNFVTMKREINTSKNFLAKLFLARYPCAI